jgi:hypothetical protein
MNAICIARKHRKCTVAAKQVHTGTIATRQRHLSASYHSSGHGVLVFYDQCRSPPGKRNMTGTQEDISSMISFTKFVETNTCLLNFTLKITPGRIWPVSLCVFNLEARYKMTLAIIVFTYLILMSNFSVGEIASLKFVSWFCNCAETTFSKNRKLSGLIL